MSALWDGYEEVEYEQDPPALALVPEPRGWVLDAPLPEDWTDWRTEDLSWQRDAACAGHKEPDIFFPTQGTPRSRVTQECNDCPVREACLAYAVRHEARTGRMPGTWGGLSETERRPLVKAAPRPCAWPPCDREFVSAWRSTTPALGERAGKYCSDEHQQAARRDLARARHAKEAKRCRLPGCDEDRYWYGGEEQKHCSEAHRVEHQRVLAARTEPRVPDAHLPGAARARAQAAHPTRSTDPKARLDDPSFRPWTDPVRGGTTT